MFLFTINLELELELFRHQHRHQQQGRRDFFSSIVSFISKTIMNAWECFGNCGETARLQPLYRHRKSSVLGFSNVIVRV